MTPPLDTAAAPARPESFRFTPMFPLGEDRTPYRKLDIGGVSTLEVAGRRVLTVQPETLEQLARAACKDAASGALARTVTASSNAPARAASSRWMRSQWSAWRRTTARGAGASSWAKLPRTTTDAARAQRTTLRHMRRQTDAA